MSIGFLVNRGDTGAGSHIIDVVHVVHLSRSPAIELSPTISSERTLIPKIGCNLIMRTIVSLFRKQLL